MTAAIVALHLLAASTSLATLDLRSRPSGVPVILDGRRQGVTPLRIDLTPGLHHVVLEAAGRPSLSIDHFAQSGERKVVMARLGDRPQTNLGIGLAAGGGALAIAGLTVLLSGGGGATVIEQLANARSPTRSIVGGVLTGAGAVIGLLSLWPFLSGSRSQVYEIPVTAPVVFRGGAGLATGVVF